MELIIPYQTQETWNTRGISQKLYSEHDCIQPTIRADLSETEMYQQRV